MSLWRDGLFPHENVPIDEDGNPLCDPWEREKLVLAQAGNNNVTIPSEIDNGGWGVSQIPESEVGNKVRWGGEGAARSEMCNRENIDAGARLVFLKNWGAGSVVCVVWCVWCTCVGCVAWFEHVRGGYG